MSKVHAENNFNFNALQESEIHKVDIGTRRDLIQIQKTISFELSRNTKKLVAMLITSVFIFGLSLLIQVITENRSEIEPTDPSEYFQEYLMLIDFVILIITTTFFGTIIAEDFEKQTANLLFPKIPKQRLLLGRFIARYFYAALTVAFYYLLVAIATLIKLDGVPKIVWGSMGWAFLYLFGLAAFFTMLSSFFNRSVSVMIFGLLGVLIVFQLLNLVIMLTGVEIEPFFILTYYANIITAWFDMPDERFAELGFGRPGPGGELQGNTYFQWITPSTSGALIGIFVYSIVCLTIAYIVYRKKQI